jgi:tetratricopeptide (TPR) repeat protein
LSLFILGTFYNSFPKEPSPERVLQKLQYQINIKDFLGAKLLAEKVYQNTSNIKVKEITYLIFWEASGFLHYKRGEFNKILEDIGGLNLYWTFFKRNPHYEDLYYDILGKLYTLLFQYRRAVIFFIEAYKRNKKPQEFLNIIYATELAYYNELRPYYNVSFIKKLLDRIDLKELDNYSKAFYNFEWGFYYLLKKNYKRAYKFFQKSYDLNINLLLEGQANFFMGRALEGTGLLKKAYYFYELALKQLKHPIFIKRTLYRLFIVSAKLGFYHEANNYLFGLTKFGGLQINPYLQEAILKIPKLGNFKKFFYWREEYKALLSSIMWLNIENNRGKRAFTLLLNDFLNTEIVFPDFLTAWQVLYPHEISQFVKNVNKEKILNFSLKGLEIAYKLYKLNKPLFETIFGDYGYLAIAKYLFLKGAWDKALTYLEKVKINHPIKFFIKGAILAYKGQPYFLENYFKLVPQDLKEKALFWLGWGYLLNNRWDLVSLYWEDFLKTYSRKDLFFAISSLYLAEHYAKLGYHQKALIYYNKFLNYLKNRRNYKGLKKWLSLKLYPLYKDKIFKELNLNKDWQKLVKYLSVKGGYHE